LSPDSRKLLEAYARGVNRFIEQQRETLPMEFTLLNYTPQPWQPDIPLVSAGSMYRTLAEYKRKGDTSRVARQRLSRTFGQESFQLRILDDHFCGWRSKCEEKATPRG